MNPYDAPTVKDGIVPPLTLHPLTREEELVIINKATEKPFVGIYCEHFEPGLYTCRHCGTPLFRSDDKFSSHCGWPSFDDALPDAIKYSADSDGVRIEVSCIRCGGHLGHVFRDENYTRKNIRFCVNSVSMNFIPASQPDFGRALLAGGCFWGVEYFLQQAPGVLHTTVGYTGGDKRFPCYQDVCSHSTGHAEAVEVIFDPSLTSFEQLTRLFLEIHDPTQLNRQGSDIGSQYRSAIFYYNHEQQQTAERLLRELRANGLKPVTELTPAERFWPAEESHRNYYCRCHKTPYCHQRVERF